MLLIHRGPLLHFLLHFDHLRFILMDDKLYVCEQGSHLLGKLQRFYPFLRRFGVVSELLQDCGEDFELLMFV